MPRTLRKQTRAPEKAQSDRHKSETVDAKSKSTKKVNKLSNSKGNTWKKREGSGDEMTQTERTHTTKKAVSNDSDRERNQILKMAPRSKSISKSKNSKGKKKSLFCLTNVAQETLQSNQRSSNGVEVTQVSKMNFLAKDGIEFAAAADGLSGLIKIKPGGEKTPRPARSELQFVVVQGTVELLLGDLNQKYSVGSTVNVPNGITYGLRNPGRKECLLQYEAF